MAKFIKLTEDFAGKAAGTVIKMENQTAASLVKRGVAAFEPEVTAPEAPEEIGKTEPKKPTKKTTKKS